MLLVFHYDKNDNEIEEFTGQDIRLDLGFFPTPNTRIRLRMIGFNNNTRGGNVFVSFPDVASCHIRKEITDRGSPAQEMPGIMFTSREGSLFNSTKDVRLDDGVGTYFSTSDTKVLDLDLGDMDTQKDFFRIRVSGRRAQEVAAGLNNLNNFSAVLEMYHQGVAT